MQIRAHQYQILVYNSEIWPENQLVHTKSNCIGFRVTPSIAVIIGVTYWLHEVLIGVAGGWVKMFSELSQ